MISQQSFPHLKELIVEERWSTITDAASKGLISISQTSEDYMKSGWYSIAYSQLKLDFDRGEFPVLFNREYFVQFCETDRFEGKECGTVGQFMQVLGENLGNEAANRGETSESAINICLYLAKVSPEHGKKVYTYLKATGLYDVGVGIEKLKQAKESMTAMFPDAPPSMPKSYSDEQYKEAILACKEVLIETIEISVLSPTLIQRGFYSVDMHERVSHPFFTPSAHKRELLDFISKSGASKAKLLYNAMKEDTEHLGHESAIEMLDKKLAESA